MFPTTQQILVFFFPCCRIRCGKRSERQDKRQKQKMLPKKKHGYPTALKRQLLSAGMTLRTSTPPSSIFIAFWSSALAVFSISFVLLAYRKSILKKITDWAIQQQQSLELCNNSSNHLGYLCNNNNKSNHFLFSFFFFFFFFCCCCFLILLLFVSVCNNEWFDVIKELSNNSWGKTKTNPPAASISRSFWIPESLFQNPPFRIPSALPPPERKEGSERASERARGCCSCCGGLPRWSGWMKKNGQFSSTVGSMVALEEAKQTVFIHGSGTWSGWKIQKPDSLHPCCEWKKSSRHFSSIFGMGRNETVSIHPSIHPSVHGPA